MHDESSLALFDDLVARAEALMNDDDFHALKTNSKEIAAARLHFTLGLLLRNNLDFWGADAGDKLAAIERHSNQGPLLGYDADGGSSSLIGYLWDKHRVDA